MVNFFRCTMVLVALLLFPQPGGATGISMPDIGLDKVFFAFFGAFALVLVVWAVLRITPYWRARLKSNPGLAVLGKINPPFLILVIAASWWTFSSDSWLLLVPMLLGVPIAVLGIVVELIWGFKIDPADRDGSPHED